MALESAIPDRLTQERSCPMKLPKDYEPPFPAYTARFPKDTKTLAVAIIGAQFSATISPDLRANAITTVNRFIEECDSSLRPEHIDWASVTDNSGYYNQAAFAYWPSEEACETWKAKSGFQAWFESLDPAEEKHGWFVEAFSPDEQRFETVFSDQVVSEGFAHMRDHMSGPVKEHVYWGSMRDRLPLAQTDKLFGAGESCERGSDQSTGEDAQARRIRVPGRQNLTVIRSGQDWSDTKPSERKLYLETMHPVLEKGMNYLRDHGSEVGCYSCRFMSEFDTAKPEDVTDRTFGLAYFDDLASLEGWSKDHKTHLDIFGRFLQYAQELEGDVSLRLFHEVLVLTPEQQWLEYVGCHAGTGMLASLE